MSKHSVLCVPGHDTHKIAQCREWGSERIMFDLEDAVPDRCKQEALRNVLEAARDGDVVRVCEIESPYHDEQVGALAHLPVRLWVSKVKTAHRLPIGNIGAVIECPIGILNSYHIAQRCSELAFGRYDFMAATGITDVWAPLVSHAMAQVALAAHASNIPASDAPCYSITDYKLMASEVARSKGYGYESKGCIHPSQIAACDGLSADDAEMTFARSMASHSANNGVFKHGDTMVGPPMVKLADRILRDNT